MTGDAYARRAGEALRRARLQAHLEEQGLAERVRELGGEVSATDIHGWESGADYPAWVLMMLYEQAGLSPDHLVDLLNHPPALFRRAYGLISGEARPI